MYVCVLNDFAVCMSVDRLILLFRYQAVLYSIIYWMISWNCSIVSSSSCSPSSFFSVNRLALPLIPSQQSLRLGRPFCLHFVSKVGQSFQPYFRYRILAHLIDSDMLSLINSEHFTLHSPPLNASRHHSRSFNCWWPQVIKEIRSQLVGHNKVIAGKEVLILTLLGRFHNIW